MFKEGIVYRSDCSLFYVELILAKYFHIKFDSLPLNTIVMWHFIFNVPKAFQIICKGDGIQAAYITTSPLQKKVEEALILVI